MIKGLTKFLCILLPAFIIINLNCENEKKLNVPLKVIVLGIDGMDPNIVDNLINEKKLPNLKKLSEIGFFSPLKTTNPAESPVAWASFITGKNPGKTNLFGFLQRDTNSYFPNYSPTKFVEGNIDHFPYYINQRKGNAFWEIISKEKKEKSAVLFCPETFPPEYENGSIISGMEVPDIRGTTGAFTFYTTDSINYLPGNNIIYLKSENNNFQTFIRGPVNWLSNNKEEVKIPVYINFEKKTSSLSIKIDESIIKIDEGQWSDWVKISFPLNSSTEISGIGKFYLSEASSKKISLYLSPINIDPQDPLFKISLPEKFSKEIVKNNGLFATLGWECDTWALNDGYLDEKAFLESAYQIFNERKKILFDKIKSEKYSMIISVFGELDRIQHMFWRYIDPKSELYEKNAQPQIKNAIFNYYKMVDDLIGQVSSMIDSSTTLFLVSDHGFAPFRRSVNLNSWLVQNGFMKLNKSNSAQNSFFKDVDWNNTKAYGLGIGGIYINLEGREKNGIVKSIQYDNLRNEIIKKLLQLEDPLTKEKVIHHVYKKENIYEGEYINSAPDLVIGLIPGYRVSQLSSLGSVEKNIFNDNLRKWSGDHVSVDPSFVPGVFFTNKNAELDPIPDIKDIAPAILNIFGVKIPQQMDGTPFQIKN